MADIFEPGYFYHVLNRGNNRENIFIEEDNYRYFLNLVKKYLLSICDIYSYCLLKNHFHILLRVKDEKELTKKYHSNIDKIHQPFSNLFNAYTKAINKSQRRSGSLFQEHPQRVRITRLNYLHHVIAYIHLNPVKHGFTNEFQHYPHSSYRTILSSEQTKIKRDDVIGFFDDIENFKDWHDSKKVKLEGELKQIEENDV